MSLPWRSPAIAVTLVAVTLWASACERSAPPATPDAVGVAAEVADAGELTAEEHDAAPAAAELDAPAPALPPVPVERAGALRMSVAYESGYRNEKGQHVIDVLERDYVYLSLIFETPDGHPVSGVRPQLTLEGSSRLMPVQEPLETARSDDGGFYEVAVVAGEMGAEVLRIAAQDQQAEVLLNIISLRAAGYPELEQREGWLSWQQLGQARVSMSTQGVAAEFPENLRRLDGTEVTLTGFMMPLEVDLKQKRFLLTSNPPSCFFHVPGGPAGAVEVLARSGVTLSWDPIVLSGRLEMLARNDDTGVIYRLHDARPLKR